LQDIMNFRPTLCFSRWDIHEIPSSVYSIWQTKGNVSGRRQQDIFADFCLWCCWHFPSG